ncbi:hypothetical protein F4810DRAFT_474158 [Camillea tinctor]|nr:hypothetical protein F4810DRAFT_474158 [Camillea tinctor]
MAHSQRSTSDYDKISGLVFRQWDVQAPNNHHEVEWYREQTPGPEDRSPGKGVTGPRSLVQMTTRVVAQNFSHLETEHLDDLPSHLIYRIGEYIEKTQETLSFHAWKLYIKYILNGDLARPQPPFRLLKHAFQITQPTEPLVHYTNPLSSTSLDFIAHLTLTGTVSFNTHEILSLAQLKNLGVLEIIQPADPSSAATFPRVTDSIVREWASQPDPFPILRIMRIWGNDFTTAKSLRYMSKFPALVLYDVSGRSKDWKNVEKTSDWEPRGDIWSDVLDRSIRRYLSILRAGDIYHTWDKGLDHRKLIIRRMLAIFLRESLPAVDLAQLDRNRDQGMRVEASQGLTSFDVWGFLLYSLLGRVIANQDLLPEGLPDRIVDIFGTILPPRPYASLGLGTGYSFSGNGRSEMAYSLNCNFETQSTFVRSDFYRKTADEQSVSEQTPETSSGRGYTTTATNPNRPLKRPKWVNDLF